MSNNNRNTARSASQVPASQVDSGAHYREPNGKTPGEATDSNGPLPYALTDSATTGFLRDMLDRNFGLYIVVGKTNSGRTALLNNYIRCSQIERRGSVVTELPLEYSNKNVQLESLEEAVARRSPYIVIDECRKLELLQDALMISTLSNVALGLYSDSIADLVVRFKTDSDLKFGSRNMLERVKGVTFTSRSDSGLVRESISLNPENRAKFMEASSLELPRLIAREINSQGRATIAQQLSSLQNED